MRSLGFCFGVLFLFVAIQENAQSIIITDIDGSSFPVMNANLKVLDNEGNRVAVDEQSITLVEDGKPCEVRVRYCDLGGTFQRLSFMTETKCRLESARAEVFHHVQHTLQSLAERVHHRRHK